MHNLENPFKDTDLPDKGISPFPAVSQIQISWSFESKMQLQESKAQRA